ncbi:MAG: PHD finger domain-containing protein [Planctomycetota bacterium]|nr:PHD finger domain-containing protein [Planctomycetota bacterium]
MSKIQSQKRQTNDGASPHCPYCRDVLSEGVIVECDQCQAHYHKECVTSCVILGCAGSLQLTGASKLQSSIRVQEKGPDQAELLEARRSRDREQSSELSSYVFAMAGLGFFLLLIVGVIGPKAAVMTFMLTVTVAFMGLVAALLFSSDATPTQPKKRKPGEVVGGMVEGDESAKKAKSSRDNFYAKPNIAPPSSDPLRPDS